MHASYRHTSSAVHWDPVRITWPVRRFPETGQSSETIGHQLRGAPEDLYSLKDRGNIGIEHSIDYNTAGELWRSQKAVDFVRKANQTRVHNKHTSSLNNQYIYPANRKLNAHPPAPGRHGTTEMQSSYLEPVSNARLVTNKEQYKKHNTLCSDPSPAPFGKATEPLYTTHEGFEKYLDPYLTTGRLHHTPFTPEQMDRESNKRNIVTYHTCSRTPWVRSPKPAAEEWHLLPRRAPPAHDRERFKNDFREIITHNKQHWTPGSFRTEIRDNYTPKFCHLQYGVQGYEEQIKALYMKSVTGIEENIECQDVSVGQYRSENSRIGSGKPLCADFNPYLEINRKLEKPSKASG